MCSTTAATSGRATGSPHDGATHPSAPWPGGAKTISRAPTINPRGPMAAVNSSRRREGLQSTLRAEPLRAERRKNKREFYECANAANTFVKFANSRHSRLKMRRSIHHAQAAALSEKSLLILLCDLCVLRG